MYQGPLFHAEFVFSFDPRLDWQLEERQRRQKFKNFGRVEEL